MESRLSQAEIELQALITEREGMVAENMQREHHGESMAFGKEAFNVLAEQIRCLVRLQARGDYG